MSVNFFSLFNNVTAKPNHHIRVIGIKKHHAYHYSLNSSAIKLFISLLNQVYWVVVSLDTWIKSQAKKMYTCVQQERMKQIQNNCILCCIHNNRSSIGKTGVSKFLCQHVSMAVQSRSHSAAYYTVLQHYASALLHWLKKTFLQIFLKIL